VRDQAGRVVYKIEVAAPPHEVFELFTDAWRDCRKELKGRT
jgi:uncharacterized protein YndB with AHSA1/START domain